MKLENQVCSLELAKRLKELGVKQESYFYWCNFGKDDWRGPYIVDGYDECGADDDRWLRYPDGGQHTFRKEFDTRDTASAFTVPELGKMLPKTISTGQVLRFLQFEPHHLSDAWYCSYQNGVELPILEEALTEADARAKMLVYLIENNLHPAN